MLLIVTLQTFRVEVLGLDLSDNMVEIAMERAIAEKLPSVCPNLAPSISLNTTRNSLTNALSISDVFYVRSSLRWLTPLRGRSQREHSM